MFQLEYVGGAHTPKGPQQLSTKFMAFFIQNQEEISLFEGKRYGIVGHEEGSLNHLWEIPTPYIKIFLHHYKFGREKLTLSVYMKIGEGEKVLTIRPPNDCGKPDWYFKCNGRILRPSEAKPLLNPKGLSYKLLQAQRLPPASVLKELIKAVKLAPKSPLGGRRRLRA